jgi:hypothetical protein
LKTILANMQKVHNSDCTSSKIIHPVTQPLSKVVGVQLLPYGGHHAIDFWECVILQQNFGK